LNQVLLTNKKLHLEFEFRITAMKTFYWYDFETFGINPKTDRISQFAGICQA
jgi:hypothetical protein